MIRARLVVGVFFTFATTMIVVGYQAALPMFRACGVHVGPDQDKKLDQMFIIATAFINVSALFAGFSSKVWS